MRNADGAAVSSFEEEERHVDMREEGEGTRILTSMGQSLWDDIKIL